MSSPVHIYKGKKEKEQEIANFCQGAKAAASSSSASSASATASSTSTSSANNMSVRVGGIMSAIVVVAAGMLLV